jgi:hypothetical protein
VLAEQLAARSIDEMKSAAGLAAQGFVAGVRIVWRGFIRQPMLHVHTGPRAFDDDMTHGACLTSAGLSVLISVNVRGDTECKRPSTVTLPRAQRSVSLRGRPQHQVAPLSKAGSVGSHSLSVIRIRPSPVTTGPSAVTAT